MAELASVNWSKVRLLKYNAQELAWYFKTDGSDWVLITVPSVFGSAADALRDAIVEELYHPEAGVEVDDTEAIAWAEGWIASAVAASEQPDSNDGVSVARGRQRRRRGHHAVPRGSRRRMHRVRDCL
jgi:hypothetical protein